MSARFCVLTAPKRARGKLLTGTITASYRGVQKSRTFTAKIKCADNRSNRFPSYSSAPCQRRSRPPTSIGCIGVASPTSWAGAHTPQERR